MIPRGRRRRGSVFNKKKEKVASGLRKAYLRRDKRTRIVSKRASTAGAQVYARNFGLQDWHKAVSKARSELGLTGFVAVRAGTAFHARAKELQALILQDLKK